MTTCHNCGAPIDIEFGSGRYTVNADSDFFCDNACERSHRTKCLEAADLPYDGNEIIPRRQPFNGYDP